MSARRKRVEAILAAELPAWERAWEGYFERVGREMRAAAEALGGRDLARRLHRAVYDCWSVLDGDDPTGLSEALAACWAREYQRSQATFEPERLAAWGEWVKGFEARRAWDPKTPDLANWPHLLPAPPEDPEPFRAEYLDRFAAAEEGTAEALHLAFMVEYETEALLAYRAATREPLPT